MAYSVTKVGGFGRPSAYREFVIDSVDDVSTLPTSDIAVGSSAFCIADKSMYAFANSGAWMKCGSRGSDEGEGGSDAGGGGVLVVNTVYDETAESYLCDASWNDIKNAFDSAAQVFLKIVSTTDPGGEYESTQTTYNLLQHLETATSAEGTNYRCTFFGNYYVDTTDPDQNMYVNY